MSGNGTPNHITKWITASKIGNSGIFETGAGNVGIGTTTPASKFDLKGAGDVRDTLTLFPSGNHPTLSISGTTFQISSTGNVTFVAGQTFPGTGTVTSVGSGAGLTGGPITKSGTLSIANGGVTNAMLQNSSLTVTANSPLTGGGSVSLGGNTSLGLTSSCASGQILKWNGASWACSADNNSGGTVTSVGSGLGLTGEPITTTGTLAINTSVVPQLAAANTFTNLNGVSVNSTGPALSVDNSGTGDGIDISDVSGAGLFVSGGSIPIFAEAASSGVDGIAASAQADLNFVAGIFGEEFGGTQETFGIEGIAKSSGGTGVYGVGIGSSTEGSGRGGAVPFGVWGDTNQSFGKAVVATADDGNAFAGYNNGNSGFPTLYLQNDENANSTFDVLVAAGPGFGGGCRIDVSGNLLCTGSKSAVVPVDDGSRKVALYAVEAPENWFEDAGSGQLSHGEVVINLDSTFAQTVNTDIDYHVFLTPNGDCRGLYVAQKSETSFVVRELGGGTSDIAFDYRIMAKRRGYEAIRLVDKTSQFAALPIAAQRRSTPLRAPIPKTPEELRNLKNLRRAAARYRNLQHYSTPAKLK